MKNEKYSVIIREINAVGVELYTDPVEFTTTADVPDSPTNLIVTLVNVSIASIHSNFNLQQSFFEMYKILIGKLYIMVVQL